MLSTKQGILNTIVGTVISLFNALVQFLTMYWVLNKFGTEFNGFIKLVGSFSILIATADGALGVATTILLVRPFVQNDWITANEIYSTAKKGYRKSALIGLLLVSLIGFAYPLYAGVSSNGSIFDINSWKEIGIATPDGQLVGYFSLVAITLIFGVKNFVTAYWFSVYENVIAADNKNSVRRIAILFTDVFVYSIMFYLLNIDSINPIFPFLSMLLYGPIKGIMIYFYAKKNYIWLKYYRDFNSFKLNTTKKKITFSSLGTSILLNTDVLIVSIVLGLSVSSTLSLYLVIAVNTRLIMTNFITSFREFFVTLVAKRGRIHWESYAKYELYTYLVAAFTFINMAILSPYFVSALYGDIASVEGQANQNAKEFMFFNPSFSILYAATTALVILCEAQITLIHAKGRYGEVSKFQNYLGFIYIVLGFGVTFICKTFAIGGSDMSLVNGIISMYVLKVAFLVLRYAYLWFYVYRYATYNSSFKHVLNNLMILLIPSILMTLVNIFLIKNQMPVEESAIAPAPIAPLIALFFGNIAASGLVLIIFSYIFSPKMMNGIVTKLPVINKIVSKKSEEARKKRFEEFGINVEEIVDNGAQLSEALYGITTQDDNTIGETEINVPKSNEKIYTIKGGK
ncbi:hypothetical protein [Spiroplasma culicicola]|uniref:Transmembrane protein n=1 Tax=Spiroplasma culicicola AES-1 TaxID=1276246 RepID=W6A645_9MOLU|nr:hypothetical protein [Spiroplasma culicicola]AHI52467.1 hypothetical protein SCULI_v1c01260 [Spiroplasma culicicola AES-1]